MVEREWSPISDLSAPLIASSFFISKDDNTNKQNKDVPAYHPKDVNLKLQVTNTVNAPELGLTEIDSSPGFSLLVNFHSSVGEQIVFPSSPTKASFVGNENSLVVKHERKEIDFLVPTFAQEKRETRHHWKIPPTLSQEWLLWKRGFSLSTSSGDEDVWSSWYSKLKLLIPSGGS